MMEILIESFRTEWLNLVRLAPRLVVALLILLVAVAAGRIVGRLLLKALVRARLTATHRRFFQHLATWALVVIGLVMAMNVLGLQTAAAGLLAGGGITAVVLGFAFREIGENFLAGFFLAFSRPFDVGDVIRSGEFQGEVRGIELRCTHIRAADGRDVFIPSSSLFNEPLVNLTRDGLRRLSFVVGIDYGDDTSDARRAVTEAIAGTPGVLPEPAPAVSVSGMLASYVELEVAFWIDVFQPGVGLAAVRSEVIERCRRALRDAGCTFSANVSTAIDLAPVTPLEVRLAAPAGDLPS